MANTTLGANILNGLDGTITVNGSINQIVTVYGDNKQDQYTLSYEAITLNNAKNYILAYLHLDDGTVNTFFFPVQFLGEQSITFNIPFKMSSLQFYIYGNLQIKDTKLQAVILEALTEEQKLLLDKVSSNGEYWDRILAITNALGNVITSKLEGSINTALNAITNSDGKMYWQDGNFIVRNGSTDATSTQAMRFSPAGFMIANGKKPDGSWDWRTFGTGAGFTADYIIAGTLIGVAIQGVTITGSIITGGTINGVTINGATIYVGDKDAGNYIEISPNNPIKVWRNDVVVSSLGYSAVGGGNLNIYDVGGNVAFKIECLSDGRLRLYCNNSTGVIPDPAHPGFYLPNPNPDTVYFDAGRVIFPSSSAGIMGYNGTTFWPFITDSEADAKYATDFDLSLTMQQHISWYHSGISDRRLKENIKYVDPADMVNLANHVKIATFNIIEDESKKERLGVIAQDLLEHSLGKYFVQPIPGREDEMMMVDYESLATTALGAVKHLSEKIETLEEKINSIERS
jgi:hypothetical protein